jgi:hypothetical protein
MEKLYPDLIIREIKEKGKALKFQKPG